MNIHKITRVLIHRIPQLSSAHVLGSSRGTAGAAAAACAAGLNALLNALFGVNQQRRNQLGSYEKSQFISIYDIYILTYICIYIHIIYIYMYCLILRIDPGKWNMMVIKCHKC